MPSKIEEVLKRIDVLRQELLEMETGNGLSDIAIVEKSQELNEVLNEYYRLLLKHGK